MTAVRVLLALGWLSMISVTSWWVLGAIVSRRMGPRSMALTTDAPADPGLDTLLGVPGPPPLEAVPDTEPDPDATPDAPQPEPADAE